MTEIKKIADKARAICERMNARPLIGECLVQVPGEPFQSIDARKLINLQDSELTALLDTLDDFCYGELLTTTGDIAVTFHGVVSHGLRTGVTERKYGKYFLGDVRYGWVYNFE